MKSIIGFSSGGIPSNIVGGFSSVASYRFCDIGINLSDDMFRGIYNGKQRHPDDLLSVLERAKNMGMQKSIITSGSISDSSFALDMVQTLPQEYNLFTTVGVHPTRANEFQDKQDEVISQLTSIIDKGLSLNRVIALGECGLDYDRLQFCDREQQLQGFQIQLDIAEKYNLPMFFHNRNTNGDFLAMVTRERSKIKAGGVVHSYTGSLEEMHALVDLGFYIGINGCSCKTEENLAVIAEIPVEKLLLETDAPWCGIKSTHAGFSKVQTQFPTKKREKYESGYLVKDRNEPCTIIQVLEVIAAVKNLNPLDLSEQIYDNTETLFFSNIPK